MSLIIPPTGRQCYISLMVALNIHSPNGTDDWHSAATFAKPLHLYMCGDNQPYNTNPLLGSAGVIDGTQRLKRMGIVSEHTPVFIANHLRACFDLLYVMVLQQGAIKRRDFRRLVSLLCRQTGSICLNLASRTAFKAATAGKTGIVEAKKPVKP